VKQRRALGHIARAARAPGCARRVLKAQAARAHAHALGHARLQRRTCVRGAHRGVPLGRVTAVLVSPATARREAEAARPGMVEREAAFNTSPTSRRHLADTSPTTSRS
jgi:hypothetical protein